jgi:hypothetical protein
MDRLTDLMLTAVVSLIIAIGAYTVGHHVATTEAGAAEKVRTAQAVKAKGDADAKVLAGERELRRLDTISFNRYRKDHEDADEKTARTIDDLRTGARRLRVPTQRQVCTAPGLPAGTAAGGPGEEGHAELAADASVFLVGLLKRGDDAITKHAAVVDAYERLRTACEKSGAPDQPAEE